MNRTDTTPTDLARKLTRRVRDEDPLRLETETLHRLPDTDLTLVVGGKPPPGGASRVPSFR